MNGIVNQDIYIKHISVSLLKFKNNLLFYLFINLLETEEEMKRSNFNLR